MEKKNSKGIFGRELDTSFIALWSAILLFFYVFYALSIPNILWLAIFYGFYYVLGLFIIMLVSLLTKKYQLKMGIKIDKTPFFGAISKIVFVILLILPIFINYYLDSKYYYVQSDGSGVYDVSNIATIASEKNDPGICDKIRISSYALFGNYYSELNRREDCYFQLSIKMKNIDFCKHNSNYSNRTDYNYDCVKKYAVAFSDASSCRLLSGTNEYVVYKCFFEVARYLNDIKICSDDQFILNDYSEKESCADRYKYFKFMDGQSNSEFYDCTNENLVPKVYRDECLNRQLSFYSSRKTLEDKNKICSMMIHEDRKKDCYEQIARE